MQIFSSIHPDIEAARRVSELLEEYKGRDVLFLVSGGSALSLLEYIDTTPMSERVTISVLDERFTHDSAVSNFSQLIATPFWERATKQHVQAIDPRPEENESLIDTSRRFDVALKHWHIIHRDGIGIAIARYRCRRSHLRHPTPPPQPGNICGTVFFYPSLCCRIPR